MNKLFRVITHNFVHKKRNITHTSLFSGKRISIYSCLFLIFFLIYSLSPLKLHMNNAHNGFLSSQTYVGFSMLFVEHMLGLLFDDSVTDNINEEDEMLVKKKRALLRSLTRFFMLLIALVSLVAKILGLSNDFGNHKFSRFISEHSNICKTSEVYLSPHSGLAPPYPVR